MWRLTTLVAMALLAGCDEFGAPARLYEVVTRTQCLTTTADNVFIKRENYWLNEGRIISVHFSLNHQPVMYVPGEKFIMYRVVEKDKKCR